MARFARLGAAAICSWFLISARAAQATEGAARACIAAHAKGQEQRSAGKLLAARDSFLSCSVDRCPAIVQRDCAAMEADLEPALPSIVLVASDHTGRDLPGVTAVLDDAGRSLPLDGRPILLDPGDHRVEFRYRGEHQQVLVLLAEGERYRRVAAQFGGSEAAPSARPLAYVFGGLGLAALASFAVFGLEGRAQQSELDKCRPNCAASQVSVMRTRYLIADISLGASLASFGLGAYFLWNGSASSGSATGNNSPASSTPHGLVLSAGGRF